MLAIQLKITDYDTKVNKIEKKYTYHKHDKNITIAEFNQVAAGNFAARLPQANVVTKTDFNDKLIYLNRKITSNKIKHLLVKNQLKS